MYISESEIQNYVAWWLQDRRRIEDKNKHNKPCAIQCYEEEILAVQERDGKMKARRDPTLWKKIMNCVFCN